MTDARRVLVTGASRGLRRVLAGRLARDGYAVTTCARDHQRLAESSASLPGEGHRSPALDVCDDAAWERAAAGLDDVAGVMCAAEVIGPIGLQTEQDLAALRRIDDQFFSARAS